MICCINVYDEKIIKNEVKEERMNDDKNVKINKSE